jgi:hydroxyacylglutathione hydrolase
LATLSQMTVGELDLQLPSGNVQVLDVRRAPEWEAGHIESATWWPLDHFKVSPPEMDQNRPIAVHCKSGYRSMIASSLLRRAGFRNVINVIGGFDAWQQAKLPSVSAKPASV